jgi:hypothetical protein
MYRTMPVKIFTILTFHFAYFYSLSVKLVLYYYITVAYYMVW